MNILAFSVGPVEITIVLLLMLLLFGKRLPEVGRSLGKGLAEFKKGIKSIEDDVKINIDEETKSAPVLANTTGNTPVEQPTTAERTPISKDAQMQNSEDERVLCQSCGHKNEKGAVFCSACGARIAPL